MSEASIGRCRGGRYVSVVCKGLICIVYKEYVLRLEVSMNEVEIMKDCFRISIRTTDKPAILTSHAGEKLLREMLYLTARERHECISLQEVEHTLPIEIGHQADMIPEVEAFTQVNTFVAVVGIVLAESL